MTCRLFCDSDLRARDLFHDMVELKLGLRRTAWARLSALASHVNARCFRNTRRIRLRFDRLGRAQDKLSQWLGRQ